MKQFISPESLRHDSYALAGQIVNSGFKPDFIVALWRGGAFIGCCVHEFFRFIGQKPDHIAIRTSRYTGIDQVDETIQVHNLGYLSERVKKTSKLLLVDDVYDTGLSIEAVIKTFKETFGDNCPDDIRTATVYFKPTRNKTDKTPEYYVNVTEKWIVFPHEIEALSFDEVSAHVNPKIAKLLFECLKHENSEK